MLYVCITMTLQNGHRPKVFNRSPTQAATRFSADSLFEQTSVSLDEASDRSACFCSSKTNWKTGSVTASALFEQTSQVTLGLATEVGWLNFV